MSAGFTRAPLHITFGPDDLDGSIEGFEARMRRPTVALARRVAKLQAGGLTDEQDIAAMVEMIAEHLVSWNWAPAESGDVAPTTVEGVDTLDIDVLHAFADKWMGEVKVPEDLGKDSRSGRSFPVELPMTVPILENLASLSKPSSTSPASNASATAG
jgi:hypothetical protein